MITCPNCQAQNREEAKFCDNCGTRLEGPLTLPSPLGERVNIESAAVRRPSPVVHPSPAVIPSSATTPGDASIVDSERRIVTILFCDVKGSTAAAERLDPEEWAELINGAFERMIRPVYRYEGMVARLMGDAILAFFGAPTAHEDDPQRAILAAMEILQEITPYRQQVQERWGVDFDVRAGINTGLVMVGQVGSDLQMEYSALGDAINVASRMETTALPGTIQVADDTYKLVAPLFDWEDLGEHEVKGKEQPVHTYRPLRQKDQPGRLRGLESYEISSPLVGREAELAFLQGRLADLLAGKGAFVMLLGEAGLGKSRLVSELQRQAAGLPPGSLQQAAGATLSYRQSSSYYPWRQALRALIGVADTAEPADVRSNLTETCECCTLPGGDLPFLQALLGVEDEIGRRAIRGYEGDALVKRMTEATRGFLCGLAREAPLLLIFDDLHWADPASLELLLNIADLPGENPLLILGIMRPDQQAPSWEFYRALQARLGQELSEIDLQPLPVETSKTLLSNLLNEDHLPSGLRSTILSKVEGNPFYLEEVVRTLIQTGALVRSFDPRSGQAAWNSAVEMEDVEIPENLQTLLVARIDRLEQESRRTLQLAAVIGRSFYYRILAAVRQSAAERRMTGESRRAAGTQAAKYSLDHDLSVLQQAELIIEAASLPEAGYMFRHALTQEAAYRTILLKQRRNFHRQVAEATETIFAGRLEEFYPVLAYHYGEAADERASRYAVLAGEAAFRLYAIPEAIMFFKQALKLAKDGHRRPGEPENGRPGEVTRLYLRLGRCYELRNEYSEALSLYKEMETFAREVRDRHMEMNALAAQALVYALPLPSQYGELARDLTGKAAVLADELDDGALQARIQWINLVSYMYEGHMDLGLPYGERAIAISRSLDLKEQLASALQDISLAYMAVGDLDRAHAVLDESGPLWEALGNLPMLAENRTDHAMERLFRADFNSAIEFSDRAYALSEQIRNNWGMVNSRIFPSIGFWARGEIDRALQNLEWVIPLAIEYGHPGATMSLVQLALLYESMGQRERAFEALQRAEVVSEKFPPFLIYAKAVEGWLYMQAGDLDSAGRLLAESASIGVGKSILEIDIRRHLYDLEYALRRAQAAKAATLAEALDRQITRSGARIYFPELAMLRAWLSSLQGDQPGALAWMERGAAAARQIEYRIVELQLERELARQLKSANRLSEAQPHQKRAQELVDFILAHISDQQLALSFQRLTSDS